VFRDDVVECEIGGGAAVETIKSVLEACCSDFSVPVLRDKYHKAGSSLPLCCS